MTLQAGDLRRRIQIQQETRTKTASGGATRVWSVVSGCSSVPCKITFPPPSKKGDESYKQGQVQGGAFTSIVIRYRPGVNISPAMRVVYGTRQFNIRTIIVDDEALKQITLQCEELQATGSKHV